MYVFLYLCLFECEFGLAFLFSMLLLWLVLFILRYHCRCFFRCWQGVHVQKHWIPDFLSFMFLVFPFSNALDEYIWWIYCWRGCDETMVKWWSMWRRKRVINTLMMVMVGGLCRAKGVTIHANIQRTKRRNDYKKQKKERVVHKK